MVSLVYKLSQYNMHKLLSHWLIQKIKTLVKAHKAISIGAILVIAVLTYWVYGKFTDTSGVTRYVLAVVQKATVTVSVSGTGQVSASNQVDVKAKVSGDLVWVGAKVGEEVAAGRALASLDDTDARKAVTDAELDLAEARLQFEKSTAQAPIDYQRKLESLQKGRDDLATEYKNIFGTVSKTFLDLPSLVTGIEGVLFGKNYDANGGRWNTSYYRNLFEDKDGDLVGTLADIAERDYKTARSAYDKSFMDFKAVTVTAERALLEQLMAETIVTTEAVAQAAKSEINLLDTVVDISGKRNLKVNAVTTSLQSDLKSYLGTANSHVNELSAQANGVKTAKESIVNTERDISILRINNPTGVKPIDLQIAENGIRKKEAALAELRSNLADYIVRAPFAGIIAKVLVMMGDSAGSGTSVATLITKQKQADISLNEVDAANVQVGDKVTITFDAIENLSLTGSVSEMDAVGVVTQGVVNYNVQITFDTQDDRVKPGMSLSASIINDMKTDVLAIPSNAVKYQGDISYVEIFSGAITQSDAALGVTSPTPPSRQSIQVGLSNDTLTEIVSGPKEGERVVLRTVNSNTKSATAQAPNIFSAAGVRGPGGNAATGGAARFSR